MAAERGAHRRRTPILGPSGFERADTRAATCGLDGGALRRALWERASLRPAPRQVLEAADGERRPALVARADPPARVAAEELGEGDQVAPVGIAAEARVRPLAGAPAVGVRDEEAREPAV